MDKYRKAILVTLALAAGVILLGAASAFLARNQLIRHYADSRLEAAKRRYGLDISYRKLNMNGLNTVELQGLSIVPHRRDTLLRLSSLQLRLNLRALLTRQIEVDHVSLTGLHVNLTKHGSVANYDFLFRKHPGRKAAPSKSSPNYARRINVMLKGIFGLLPANGELNNILITERTDSRSLTLRLPSLHIADNRFTAPVDIREDSTSQHWQTRGELNRSTRTLQAELSGKDSADVLLPYLERRLGAKVSFRQLACSLSLTESRRQRSTLQGTAKIDGLRVFHTALSPETISLDRGKLAYCIHAGNGYIEMDSASLFSFNQLDLHPYLRLEKPDSLWHITASLHKPWFPAHELFGSLPPGLFQNLEGLKTTGDLAYRFYLDADFARIDSLKLESDLQSRNFRITGYGKTNLAKMNGEFLYTAYEDGIPVRTFPVGPSWEHFTPLDSISPLLQNAVLQSEDGSFFHHNGFRPEELREALIYDLKAGKFARGGSTISMQTVKNVFLNRSKNMARKAEEALIVWLIESQHLTSKRRMYEVYLNIAEWGPGVYGIGEASAFYFGKRPSALTLEESVFLASLVPKPKHYLSSFTADMQLKESLQGYFRTIARRLALQGLITENEADSIRPVIQVTDAVRHASKEK